MQIFRINENEQEQFAEAPEIAMDLNFGQSDASFYLVVSCRMAITLDADTFAQPESKYLQQRGSRRAISAEERTDDFLQWFNALPPLPRIAPVTPAQAWQSFMGAMGPVSSIVPLPPPPPGPPSIYGHLPFKSTTVAETVIYRWEAYPTSRRIDRIKDPPTIAKDTYAAPALRPKFLSRRPVLGPWRDSRCRA